LAFLTGVGCVKCSARLGRLALGCHFRFNGGWLEALDNLHLEARDLAALPLVSAAGTLLLRIPLVSLS
jgi:hypothetical protein